MSSLKLELHGWRRKGRKREEEEEGEEGEEQRYVFFFFFMESSVFLMSRVFGMNFPWMISYSFPWVLLGEKIILTLEFLKFCG